MKKYPFKFLAAYDKYDADVFFGRDEEIITLYNMVFQNSTVLVYGTQGAGKTSVIQCGLAHKFKSYDWLPITIRRGRNIIDALRIALIDVGGNNEIEGDEINSDKETKLRGFTKLIEGVCFTCFKPVYLIFDQFEELYIQGTKKEQEQFIEAVKEIQNVEQPVKMIFSIREEYLGYLYEFEKKVPQLLKIKLRIEPMTMDKVKNVIEGINNYELSNVRIKSDEIEAITNELFERLKGKKKTLTIQLAYLQVFFDNLYIHSTGDASRRADALISMEMLNRIGDIGDVLRNLLEDQVIVISQKLNSRYANVNSKTIWNILSPFSTLDGMKEPLSKQELAERLPDLATQLIDEVVESFVNSRILYFNESSNLYEIAHDSLVFSISEKRSVEESASLEVRKLIKNQVSIKQDARELFTEKQLNFIEPYLNKLNLSDEEIEFINESKANIVSTKKKKWQIWKTK